MLDMVYGFLMITCGYLCLSLIIDCCRSVRNIEKINKEISSRIKDLEKNLDEDLILISNRIKEKC